MEIFTLDGKKTRIVEVVSDDPPVSFVNTSYEDGEELFKIEDGLVWVNDMSFVRHPSESFRSTWKIVLPEKIAKRVIIKSWPDNECLSVYEIGGA